MADDQGEPGRPRDVARRIGDFIIEILSRIPESTQDRASEPLVRARELVSGAALRAAAISGTLALPPGPAGVATILPDLYAIWRLQAQMVADIAAVYGQTATLTREAMLYCLFRHAAAQAVRDIAVRAGERMLVRRASLRAMQKIAQAIGGRITQRVIRSAVARWLPIIGAMGIAAYAYFDTGQVGETAIEFFSQESNAPPAEPPPATRA